MLWISKFIEVSFRMLKGEVSFGILIWVSLGKVSFGF